MYVLMCVCVYVYVYVCVFVPSVVSSNFRIKSNYFPKQIFVIDTQCFL